LARGNNVDWDGINKINGQPAETGWYFYKLKAKDKFENVEELQGKIYLDR
jgi:glycine cleavage system H lipoate-binding protein